MCIRKRLPHDRELEGGSNCAIMGAMAPHPDLENLRRQIDDIDAAWVALLARRFCLTDQVGHYKKAHGLQPVDEAREQAQFSRIRDLADEQGLDPDFAETFLRCIIAQVVKNHQRA